MVKEKKHRTVRLCHNTHTHTLQTSRFSEAETASQQGKTHQALCKINDMVKPFFSLYYVDTHTHTHRAQPAIAVRIMALMQTK